MQDVIFRSFAWPDSPPDSPPDSNLSLLQHYDAFNLNEEDGRRFASNGGQRTVTVLVYLNDVARGGATTFPNLQLNVQPRQGMALVFFPSTLQGELDRQALHAAMPAVDTKYVSQIWIRQSSYFGQASKRLSKIMGAPMSPQEAQAHPGTNDHALPTYANGKNDGGGVQPMSPWVTNSTGQFLSVADSFPAGVNWHLEKEHSGLVYL